MLQHITQTAHCVLGVEEGASAAEIKAAYKQHCLQWHPDKQVNAADDDSQRRAKAMFQRAQAAYDELSST